MNIETIREQLLRRRNEIFSIATQIDKHIGHREQPLDPDSSERAIELENLDTLFAIDRETRQELRQINDAIERIDIGHYGFCSECGSGIEAARLLALPYIDTCSECAKQTYNRSSQKR